MRILDADAAGACDAFSGHVRSVEAAIIHTCQITAHRAIREADREADPKAAAAHWEKMVKFCDAAFEVVTALRGKFPGCGTSQLYDLVLEYREQADKRFYQNLRDSEIGEPPEGLFSAD